MTVTCKVEIPQQGAEVKPLTVGREFQLNCAGPWVQLKSEDSLRFEMPEQAKYALKLLSAKKVSSDEIIFTVTSYQAGSIKVPAFVLTDGVSKVEMPAVDFEVQTVLDQTQQQQEPFGPLGPLAIPVPMLWWALLAVAVILPLWWAAAKTRRILQRRQVLEKLREHDGAQTPLAEYHQKLRRLRRDHVVFAGRDPMPGEAKLVVSELEQAFRLFFLRVFRLPALTWPDRVLLREFKRDHRAVFKLRGDELRRLLREFAAAKSANEIAAKDALQLVASATTWAEAVSREEES